MKQTKTLSMLAFLCFSIGIASIFIAPTVLATDTGLPNPIGITDPRLLAGRVIKAILGIVGSVALLVFIYGGFMWVASGGNEEKVKKGKDAIKWASLGIAIIFLSYAVVTFVIDAGTGGAAGGFVPNEDNTLDSQSGRIMTEYIRHS